MTIEVKPVTPSPGLVAAHRNAHEFANAFCYVVGPVEVQWEFVPGGGGADWDGSCEESDARFVTVRSRLERRCRELGGELRDLMVLPDCLPVKATEAHLLADPGAAGEEQDGDDDAIDEAGMTEEELAELREQVAKKKKERAAQRAEQLKKTVEVTRARWAAELAFPTQLAMLEFLSTAETKLPFGLALPQKQNVEGDEGVLLCKVSGRVFPSTKLQAFVTHPEFLLRAGPEMHLLRPNVLETQAAAALTRRALGEAVDAQHPGQNLVRRDRFEDPRFVRVAAHALPEGFTASHRLLVALPNDVRKPPPGSACAAHHAELVFRLRDMLQLPEEAAEVEVLGEARKDPGVLAVRLRYRCAEKAEKVAARVKAEPRLPYLSAKPVEVSSEELWLDLATGTVSTAAGIEPHLETFTRPQPLSASDVAAALAAVVKTCRTAVGGKLYAADEVLDLQVDGAAAWPRANALTEAVLLPKAVPPVAPREPPSEELQQQHRAAWEKRVEGYAADHRYGAEVLASVVKRLEAAGTLKRLAMKRATRGQATIVSVEAGGAVIARVEGAKAADVEQSALLKVVRDAKADVTTADEADALLHGRKHIIEMYDQGTVSVVAAQPAAANPRPVRREAEYAKQAEEPLAVPRKTASPMPRVQRALPEEVAAFAEGLKRLEKASRAAIEALTKQAVAALRAGHVEPLVAALLERLRDTAVPPAHRLAAWYAMDSVLKASLQDTQDMVGRLDAELPNLVQCLPCKDDAALADRCKQLLSTWQPLFPHKHAAMMQLI